MRDTLIILTFVLFSVKVLSQLDVENSKNAWQRTAYEKWDDFKPWIYFKILNRGYDDDDRRTMYSRMGQMTLWSVYADQYEMHLRSVDSVFAQETYKALDKTLNKNWLVLQKTRASSLYDKIEKNITVGIDGGVPPEIYGIFQQRYFDIVANIEFIKSSYSPDAEKYPIIEGELKKLRSLFEATAFMETLALLWDDNFAETIQVDYSDQIELNRILINGLIQE